MSRNAACRMIAFLFALTGAAASVAAQESVRDSSGVHIIENRDPSTAPLAFVVDTIPRLKIGGQNADLNYEIVRASSALLLANGNVAVAMLSDAQVRIFDRDGKYVKSVGRKGRGPGEFSTATIVSRGPADHFLVYDQLLKRSTEFTLNGDFVRVMPSPTAVSCCLPGGGFLAIAYRRTTQSLGGRSSWAAIRVGADSTRAVHDTLVFFPGSDAMLNYSPAMQPAGGAVASISMPAPFGKISTVLPTGSGFLIGDGSNVELKEYGEDGRLARIIRARAEPVVVTPTMRRRYEGEALRGRTGMQRSNELAAMRAFNYPPTAPAFRNVLIDSARRIWMERYPLPGDARTTWFVFASSGALIGRAETPIGQPVVSIAGDELITLRRDVADGTTTVNVLRFRASR